MPDPSLPHPPSSAYGAGQRPPALTSLPATQTSEALAATAEDQGPLVILSSMLKPLGEAELQKARNEQVRLEQETAQLRERLTAGLDRARMEHRQTIIALVLTFSVIMVAILFLHDAQLVEKVIIALLGFAGGFGIGRKTAKPEE